MTIRLIKSKDPKFPHLLKEIPNAPKELYALGDLPGDDIPRVAIVGTRKATEVGKFLAKLIAEKLGERGIIVVSGLAMGIDAASHEGALLAKARTIAVLGNGLDNIYPRQNEHLARRIIEGGGVIISEYPPKTPGLPHQFLERNRIISGLAVATVVVEAPLESGALVTARLAAEQGREVFVFPGFYNHPNYQGSHGLIRDGARLVSSVEDILDDLGFENTEMRSFNFGIEDLKDRSQLMILELIQNIGEPLPVDKIIELTKLEPQAVNRSLTMLALRNLIKETERGYMV